MKRFFTLSAIMLTALLLASPAFGQKPVEEHKAAYERQVRSVGYDGPGVMTILDRWAADYPDDCEMLEGRYHYYMTKASSVKVVRKDVSRYLGKEPTLTLRDSSGRNVNYFEETFFNDSLFTLAVSEIARAVELSPADLAYRIDRITAFMLYEKGSPDLAEQELRSLIGYRRSESPEWKYYGLPVDDGTFVSAVQEYCYNFFKCATPGSYEALRSISEEMLKLYPGDAGFLGNIGSYWLVYKHNPRKALKYYDKALKASSDNYDILKNCVVASRRLKNGKLEKKYLSRLVGLCTDEMEKASFSARLEALSR